MIGRDSRVLDVACGRGATALCLARETACEITGLDYSVQSAAAAASEAARQQLGRRARFVVGDAASLPYPPGSFDVVICECALCTFPDKGVALREMARVLKPGGRLGLSDMTLDGAEVPEALKNVLGVALCITGARGATETAALIENSGFAQMRITDARWALLEMVESIEKRAAAAASMIAAAGSELPEALASPGQTIAAAREFVQSGGLGYALFASRLSG